MQICQLTFCNDIVSCKYSYNAQEWVEDSNYRQMKCHCRVCTIWSQVFPFLLWYSADDQHVMTVSSSLERDLFHWIQSGTQGVQKLSSHVTCKQFNSIHNIPRQYASPVTPTRTTPPINWIINKVLVRKKTEKSHSSTKETLVGDSMKSQRRAQQNAMQNLQSKQKPHAGSQIPR